MNSQANTGWDRLAATSIEDLQDAVKGAGLDAVQLSNGAMTGSLAFCTDGDVTYTSGLIGGKVRLSGALSEKMITLGVGVDLAPGSRHWMRDVETGGIGVFLAGDEHDAIYMPGTTYAAATLSAERLEERAASVGYILDVRQLGRTGISDRRVANAVSAELKGAFSRVHLGREAPTGLGGYMLDAIIRVLGREPRSIPAFEDRAGHGRIVARGTEYIRTHLEGPLHISAIARVACTSQSTLYRAFHCMLGETPQSYVRKLRLNRIRHDLATDAEASCTITTIAARWGITEFGRLSGWYREAFGELPSATRARHLAALAKAHVPAGARMKISAYPRTDRHENFAPHRVAASRRDASLMMGDRS